MQHWSELVGVERLVESHSGNWTPNRLKRIGGEEGAAERSALEALPDISKGSGRL